MIMEESLACDVVIVGAGLSGLSAAYFLVKKDRSLRIAVLEAKDRIGGRTLTKQLIAADGTKDFWDLGGEWIGRPQPHLQYLLKKFEVNIFKPVSPRTCSNHCVSWKTYLDLWQLKWNLQRLQKKLDSIDSRNASSAVLYDGVIFEDFLQNNLWTCDAKAIVEAASHCMFGLTPKEMTLLYFIKNVESAGGLDTLITPEQFTGGESRVKGGMQQVSNHLVNRIGKQHVYLSQPVVQIVQSIEGARVMTLNGMHVLCQRVILAVPSHHSASIQYQPELPSAKLELLQNIPLAFLIKFIVTYENAFWRKGKTGWGRGFQAVLTDPQMGPVGMVYDSTSGRGNPALSGFISNADKIDPDIMNRRRFILCLIEELLGPQCLQHLEFSQMDWSLEPYNGGCFLKNFIPETFKYFNNEIREPFDRIHFAGTETATVWCGFMDGAVQAGFRAASEVIYHLRPLIPASPYPEDEKKEESKPIMKSDNSNWYGWLAFGAGVASIIYLFTKTNRDFDTSDTFVRNIRLVFDPLK